jgi:hypothetical protein
MAIFEVLIKIELQAEAGQVINRALLAVLLQPRFYRFAINVPAGCRE